jgi:uncharacterized protein YfaS (alpha-2-macroglobulin family)
MSALPLTVREYAPQRDVAAKSKYREDFRETLYWHPVLVLPDGRGEFVFDLCDSVTTFEVRAAGHTLDGRLAEQSLRVESRLPLVLEPKLPIEVTSNDRIDLPLSMRNNSEADAQVTFRVSPHGLALLKGRQEDTVRLAPDRGTRKLFRLRPTLTEGQASLTIEGGTDQFAGDAIRRTLRVVPDGFPGGGRQSDLLEGTACHVVELPEHWLRDTLHYEVTVYPSTLAELQKGLESLLQEPHGCFEQTSTANYPNLLILDYLETSDQARPDVARRARDLLATGYQKLTSFECENVAKGNREGYEWFGGRAAPHEALTAYGLLQFRDMARVHQVDPAMLKRTRDYLLARRDGKGGFLRNPRALDTFGRAPDHITNAYIVWALVESGDDADLTTEIKALVDRAAASQDPYYLALVANTLLKRGQTKEGLELTNRLVKLQHADGYLDALDTSITGSAGRDLRIETTALSLLAWLQANRHDLYNSHVQAAVKWIGQQRGGQGGFGSTQSTILALKALLLYTRNSKQTAEAGELALFVGDRKAASTHFEAGRQEPITLALPDPQTYLKAGTNKIRLAITGKNAFPYSAHWSYRMTRPDNTPDCPVRLETRLDREKANEGETVTMTAVVENLSGKGQGMTVAILGLPAGLTLPENLQQLKDLASVGKDGAESGPISFWEIRGRELVLYWRDFAPGKKVEVKIDLTCRVPGTYRGPASRAYLYYNADHKYWVDPLTIAIQPGE